MRLAQAELHLAGVHLAQGRGELARPPLLECLRTFRDLRDPWGIGTSLRLLGQWHLSVCEPAVACSLLESAVEQLRTTGQPYATARALQLLGEARLAAGQREPARVAGTQAWQIFDEIGAAEAERLALWLSAFDS